MATALYALNQRQSGTANVKNVFVLKGFQDLLAKSFAQMTTPAVRLPQTKRTAVRLPQTKRTAATSVPPN